MFTPTLERCWSWEGVIEINSTALKGIIDALFAMLGLATRLSPGVYRQVLRLLRPTESAVRRLIVIAARGLVVKPVPVRTMPKGSIIAKGTIISRGKGTSARVSFQLFDTRKYFPELHYNTPKRKRGFARIRVLECGHDPRVSAFWPNPRRVIAPPPPPPPSDGLVDASRITRRLQALKAAFEDLPHQALRLARWRLKREAMPSPAFKSPLRPGRPPGYRRKKPREIDGILSECHYFAWEAMKKPDTS